MNSIIQKEKECLVCRSPWVELHHVFFGTKDRKVSDKHGFTVWLCNKHHQGSYSPHKNRAFDLELKEMCQREFEKTHSRREFMELIGRNYLNAD